MIGLALFAVTACLLAAAASIVISARNSDGPGGFGGTNGRERVFAVTVIPVEPSAVTPQITAFGEIQSGRTLELRAAASGALTELSSDFVEGGQVRAGALLFQTDPSAAQATLALAETELAEAQSERSEAIEALSLSEDEVAAAERQLNLREQALARQENLRERGVGTDAALETAALSLSSAETALLGKRQALANAKARINTAETNLARMQINHAEAKRKLDDLSVMAEFDGVLANVKGVLGGLVNANEKLGDLIDPDALEVSFQISARDFATLAAADGGIAASSLTLTVPGSDAPVSAKITRASAAVAEGQTGREIFARLDSAGAAALRTGDFVTVTLEAPTLPFASIIPASAANAAGEVLVLGEDNRLSAVTVEILRKQGDDIIIRPRGIAGEKIVKRRIPQIGAGIKVAPRDDVAPVLEQEEMVELTDEEKERFTAGISNAPIPEDRKKRILDRIASGKMPKSNYERMKSRMGG
ncbi:MAG: HlyD family efflux transporter periplasmic adaptor subunit [Pseudomonadota bacterium]